MLEPSQLLWSIPLALVVVLLLQLLHLLWLALTTRRTQEREVAPYYPPVSNLPTNLTPQQPYVPPGTAAQQLASAPPMPRAGATPGGIQPGMVPVGAAPAQPTPAQGGAFVARPTAAPGAPAAPAAPRVVEPAQLEVLGRLIVLSGLNESIEIPLRGTSIGVGRYYNVENSILVALDEKSISRKHAVITINPQTREYFVSDTYSSYGTFVLKAGQFQQIEPGKNEPLYNEDVLQFGNVVRVRLILPTPQTRDTITRI